MQKKFSAMLLVAAMILSLVTTTEAAKFGDNYRLEKVLIFSRHNIRSPHIDEAKQLTPHKWFAWTSPARELSLRGGLVETALGQYFRKYLVDENFMTENYLPEAGEFLFYPNSRQRTVATAQYFSSGMLPVANVKVEHKFKLETRDLVFSSRLIVLNDKLRAEIKKQARDYLNRDLSANFALVNKILDFKNSPYARKHNITALSQDDAIIDLKLDKQPSLYGTISAAFEAADSLILQYYETQTAFGRKLTDKQWRQIGELNALAIGMLKLPAVAGNVAHPLLECMQTELNNDGRRFTFLCGHDANIVALTGALGVEDYSLPDAIEPYTPVGVKFVIEKWRGADGEAYASISLVYPSTRQIINIETLTLDNPPKIFPLRLKGLQANADGLYLFSDVQRRFADAAAQFDSSARKAA